MMTVSDYLAALPELRKQRVLDLIRIIKELYPDAQESLLYKMPTYQWQQGWVAVADQKGYVSLYTCSAGHVQQFRQKHPKLKYGKACINFRDNDPLPLLDLRQVITSAMTAT